MKTQIALSYGNSRELFSISGQTAVLMPELPVRRMDAEGFKHRLAAFLSGTGLDLSRPAVVVADETRLCGYPEYLPVLLDCLQAFGAQPERICLFIAYGTHAPQGDKSSLTAYGPVFRRYRWIQHCCQDDDLFVKLGTTRRGTPVVLRRDIIEASCLITFGAVSHHYFAGFGGGRKLIFPGLGQREAVYANHSLFLDHAKRCLAHGCQPGSLDGNPLAEDLEDYEAFRPADMAVHGILDRTGRVCELLVGSGRNHFRAACARHSRHYTCETDAVYDLVLASCGGFPKDINFIQSHKSVHHAAAFVRDGGHLILLAQCREGIGSQTFLPWFQLGGWDAAFDRLSAAYAGNGGTALAMMAKTRRIRISLVTELDPETARIMDVAALSAKKARSVVKDHQGSLAVLPAAALLVKKPAA